MQQIRLFPYLAASFIHHHFSREFFDNFHQFLMAGMTKENPEELALMGQEIHGISSSGKPWAGWTAQAAIQECREACGGHGYLKAARFGDLRDDNDANCTYEGDNNVTLTDPTLSCPGPLLKTTPTPPGYPWVSGVGYVTPEPRNRGLVLDHQLLKEPEPKKCSKRQQFLSSFLALAPLNLDG